MKSRVICTTKPPENTINCSMMNTHEYLQPTEKPQLPDLKAAQGGSGDEHTELVQRLIPEHADEKQAELYT